MANAINSTTLATDAAKQEITFLYTVLSDGTEESGTVMYDSSVVCTALGIPDSKDCTIRKIDMVVSSVAAKATLLFDATTDVVAVAIPQGNSALKRDYDCVYGGLPNYA